ncbi:MAG TPA: MFS transporter [Vicinamibacterales bacterium]|nr:MFS transporter [Vicinamibacterales bacterium]
MNVVVDERHGAIPAPRTTAVRVLAAISLSHLLNDTIQSLIPSIYPILKASFALNYSQVGLIALTLQLTASLLQPVVGMYTDRRPMPYSLVFGMGFSMVGLLLLSIAGTLAAILIAAGLVGVGSSVFHPESSRIARMASGGRHGLAQSVFQVGGNLGSSLGPLLAAFVVVPHGQASLAWCALIAVVAMALLLQVGHWSAHHRPPAKHRVPQTGWEPRAGLSRARVVGALLVLAVLIFSKYFYLASLSSYYTFYLISRFGVSVPSAQLHLFVFLGSVAAGTILGGPIGDRIGPKWVIWGSILGVFPFTFALPFANLFWTGILTVAIGLILASAFSAILVYAQELVPGRVGTIGGIFFGFAFGMGGLGAAALGRLADATSIEFVYRLCAYLPLIGLLTAFLPDLDQPATAHAPSTPAR